MEVLAAVPLPDGYPSQAEVTFGTSDEHAFVQYELPPMTVVPLVKSVVYVKTRDELVPKRFTVRELTSLYRSVVSQVSLLVVRDLFDADAQLRQVSFNGMVHRTNPATGRPEYPCLISLMVERNEFEGINLEQVTPEKCLQYLKAQVFNHPDEVEGVPAFFDFDKTRYAFVEGVDVVADLDHRPDLMAMSPSEFEHLVRQVFEAAPDMTGWTTRASKDDGVDAVIRNSNPVTGGLTVVQAKQYSHAIGVSHVRELYGTMEDTRAGHGILVTTSTFTKDSKLLARRLVRIQLIDGAGLVDLIKKYLHKDVLIGRRPKRP
jgi:restriction system protein